MRAVWRRLAAIAILLLAIADGGPAAAESRVALVIGNGNYQTVPTLANPPHDAKDVAAALQSLGFAVTVGVDLDQAGMARAIAAFSKAAAEADVSLFYYGGHGVQVAGRNYLIPVDAQLHDEDDIDKHTVHFDEILKAQEQGKGIHLIFLDACRTNPLTDAAVSLRTGLARVGNAAGFLIAFATQPDNVAYDGPGRNSPFAQSLLGHLSTVGQDISSMMIEVRKDVIATTGGAQIPWENSSLTRQFYFAPGEVAAASPEALLWQLAGGQKDANLLRIYLDRYPDGAHLNDVKELLAEIAKQGDSGGGGAPQTAAAKENVEDLLWGLAKGGREPPIVELYLARYPSGAHAKDAQTLLESLQDAQGAGAPAGILCQRLATHPDDGTANFPGVDLRKLTRNVGLAINACREAVAQHPDEPHFVALLARAVAAAGLDHRAEAIALFKKAADAGDGRAMVSLGLIYEAGDPANNIAKDVKAANDLYAKAATRGNADGAINLALNLNNGAGVERDVPRAIALLRGASDGGSAIATCDLGELVYEDKTGKRADALDLFRRCSSLGNPHGYLGAATVLDEGWGVPRNPDAAADELLRGVAEDAGESFHQLTDKAAAWRPETIKAVQSRLKSAGYYSGPIDGKGGAVLAPALKQWRLLGSPQKKA